MKTTAILSFLALLSSALPARPASFLALRPLPSAQVTASAPPYAPEYTAAHLTDGDRKTEFASRSAGTNTFVEFSLPEPSPIAAIRHLDRNDPATVAESECQLFDSRGTLQRRLVIPHLNQPQGETFYVLPEPVTAQRIRWQVTRLGNPSLPTVGGAELSFYTTGGQQNTPTEKIEAQPQPYLLASGLQPVTVTVHHLYSRPAEAVFQIGSREVGRATLQPGENTAEINLPEAIQPAEQTLTVLVEGQPAGTATFQQAPVRHLTIYITPHSHTDIGYTAAQSAIEQKQVQNLLDGMAAARRTASYPEGARFVWNVEVAWAADLCLQRLDAEKRAQFLEAVRAGQVVLNGMYLNELTGLCRPEELLQLFRFATRLSETTGVPIDTAMISDVPGYTWGAVTAMAQAGIKYFSTAPNYFDRIGTILQQWENKPFYWIGPDGATKVLVWIPFWGYAMSHKYHQMSPRLVADLYEGLDQRAYPFDIAYVRWSGHGDNATPDPAICDFVRDWNATHSWPRFIISGASAAFRAFEQRYGPQLPTVRGDWTPYWEDGAGSSAAETSLNRNTSDQLSAAAAAFAILRPAEYPAEAFREAWRNVLLYSEHTWGAWCSVSEPTRQETLEQWAVKKSYAEQAARQTTQLTQLALRSATNTASFEVLNTLSWPRTELVILPPEMAAAGERVIDSGGHAVPSQRLRSGGLAFMARRVPPFSTRAYTITQGSAECGASAAQAAKDTLATDHLQLRVDENTGGIVELRRPGLDGDFVDPSSGETLDHYTYFLGDDTRNLQRAGRSTITLGEKGPLVASLLVDSPAPGAAHLHREIRVVAGQDYAEIINDLDKTRLPAADYRSPQGKESVNFAFPFQVPDGRMLIDVPLGAFRPEQDQIPSACKNWLTTGRWVEIASPTRGVTWVTLDAPLIQVGELSANLLNSQTNPEIWRQHIGPSRKLYSWAMNNHWGTNYRAYQEGRVRFRYIIRPHTGPADPAAATRFATAFSQPLLIRPTPHPRDTEPLLQLTKPDIIVTTLKPSDDRQALILRFYGASGTNASTELRWADRKPHTLYLSDTSEHQHSAAPPQIPVPGFGLVTLRAPLQ